MNRLPILTMIAAMDRNRAIGRDNSMPWHLPDDFKHFKARTLGKPVLMGRLTAFSLGRALPGRLNLVLTRGGSAPYPGMVAVDGVARALELTSEQGVDELCVIGGGQVYALCLPLAQRLSLTQVDTEITGGDAYFPVLEPGQWQEASRVHHERDDKHAFAFDIVDYTPRNALQPR